jgi:hypothetical protein
VVSAFALGAARVSGIDDSGAAEPSAEPTLVLPSSTPTATDPTPTDPTQSDTATPQPSPTPTRRSPISLEASPAAVLANERVNLTGAYRANGAQLQVQRFEGRWQDFPVTASVDAGRFSTYVQSARIGKLRYRVVDKASGLASNEVRVTVR